MEKPSLENKILNVFDVLWYIVKYGELDGAEQHVEQEKTKLIRELYGYKQ